MADNKSIIECYDKTAESYAEHYINELEGKHLDRMLLKTFAIENKDKGELIDLGCGPGQTTKFLFDCDFTNITGIDISPQMIETAKKCHPAISFDTADIMKLKYADNKFGSAIAFYS